MPWAVNLDLPGRKGRSKRYLHRKTYPEAEKQTNKQVRNYWEERGKKEHKKRNKHNK